MAWGEGGGVWGGRERDEDKECKAKECAFRHVPRPNPSMLSLNLITKTDSKEIHFPFSILNPYL